MDWETSEAPSNGKPEINASQLLLISQLAQVVNLEFHDLFCSQHLWTIPMILKLLLKTTMETKQEDGQIDRQTGLPFERNAQAISCRALKTEDMKSQLSAGLENSIGLQQKKNLTQQKRNSTILRQWRDLINFLLIL